MCVQVGILYQIPGVDNSTNCRFVNRGNTRSKWVLTTSSCRKRLKFHKIGDVINKYNVTW